MRLRIYNNSLDVDVKQVKDEPVRQRKRPAEGKQSYNNTPCMGWRLTVSKIYISCIGTFLQLLWYLLGQDLV